MNSELIRSGCEASVPGMKPWFRVQSVNQSHVLRWLVAVILQIANVAPHWAPKIVTNITLTGSAMVNWSRGLLIQGVTTVIVVNVHTLGHFVGWSASIKGSRSPRHCKQTRLGWEVGLLVYSDEGRHWYRWVPGSGTWWSSSRLTCDMGTVSAVPSPVHESQWHSDTKATKATRITHTVK